MAITNDDSRFISSIKLPGEATPYQIQDTNALTSSDVIDNVTSTTAAKPLSANMGKELQDEITNLKARGRFLSLWNCSTGLPVTNPTTSPYTYQTGDYYIISVIATGSASNYKPDGSTYTIGVASAVIETDSVSIDDIYYFDGSNWKLQINTQKTVTFAGITGQPTDNANLATALNAKAPLASPALTGIPTAPTATAGTSTTQLATTEFVMNAINAAITQISGGSW